jgi:Tol biopolymer transport system component
MTPICASTFGKRASTRSTSGKPPSRGRPHRSRRTRPLRRRYGQFVPFLGGISGEFVDFSKDGQWVAYVSYLDGILWRCKSGRTDCLQLTYMQGYAVNPRWSPNGKTIVFFEISDEGKQKIYTVSPDGGTPKVLLPDDPNPQRDPNWSPDGAKIVFGGAAINEASNIRILDLATRRLSTLPRSLGLYSPRWYPTGRYIAGQQNFSSSIFRLRNGPSSAAASSAGPLSQRMATTSTSSVAAATAPSSKSASATRKASRSSTSPSSSTLDKFGFVFAYLLFFLAVMHFVFRF